MAEDTRLSDDVGALTSVIERLESRGLPVWLDSGTLLGMTREGAFIESDPDIDISVLCSGDEISNEVDWLRERFNGWRVLTYRFRGQISRIKVIPPASQSQRSIDMMVVRPVDRMLVAHSTYRAHPVDLTARVLEVVKRVMCKVHASIVGVIDVSRLQSLGLVNVGTWTMPRELILPVARDEQFKLPVPAHVENYLAYRYGEWRTPTEDWVYWRDDGAFHTGMER